MRAVLVLFGALCLCGAAAADEIGDCEQKLVRDAKAFGTGVTGVAYVRDEVRFDRYDAMVGSQRVSSVIYGPADVTDAAGRRRLTVVCLHAGTGKGPVFAWMLP